MGKHKKGPGNIPLTVWLGYLLAVTFLVTGVTFSSYITTTSGGDSARVARWSVAEDGTGSGMLTVRLAPGESKGKVLTVEQKSEVAAEYIITVTNLTGNLPLLFSVTPEGGLTNTSHEDPKAAYQYTTVLEPNAGNKTFTLTVSWPTLFSGAESPYWSSHNPTDPELSGMVDVIAVDVKLVQKD